MKNVILLLLLISFLLQSCHSYVEVTKDSKNLRLNKSYKIKEGNTYHKGVLINFTDSIITLDRYGREKSYSITALSKIKQRKFSAVKTILLPVGIIAVTLITAQSAVSVEIGELNSPNRIK